MAIATLMWVLTYAEEVLGVFDTQLAAEVAHEEHHSNRDWRDWSDYDTTRVIMNELKS